MARGPRSGSGARRRRSRSGPRSTFPARIRATPRRARSRDCRACARARTSSSASPLAGAPDGVQLVREAQHSRVVGPREQQGLDLRPCSGRTALVEQRARPGQVAERAEALRLHLAQPRIGRQGRRERGQRALAGGGLGFAVLLERRREQVVGRAVVGLERERRARMRHGLRRVPREQLRARERRARPEVLGIQRARALELGAGLSSRPRSSRHRPRRHRGRASPGASSAARACAAQAPGRSPSSASATPRRYQARGRPGSSASSWA